MTSYALSVTVFTAGMLFEIALMFWGTKHFKKILLPVVLFFISLGVMGAGFADGFQTVFLLVCLFVIFFLSFFSQNVLAKIDERFVFVITLLVDLFVVKFSFIDYRFFFSGTVFIGFFLLTVVVNILMFYALFSKKVLPVFIKAVFYGWFLLTLFLAGAATFPTELVMYFMQDPSALNATLSFSLPLLFASGISFAYFYLHLTQLLYILPQHRLIWSSEYDHERMMKCVSNFGDQQLTIKEALVIVVIFTVLFFTFDAWLQNANFILALAFLLLTLYTKYQELWKAYFKPQA